MIGNSNASIVKITVAKFSPVAMTGFPKPAVMKVDAALVTTVVP